MKKKMTKIKENKPKAIVKFLTNEQLQSKAKEIDIYAVMQYRNDIDRVKQTIPKRQFVKILPYLNKYAAQYVKDIYKIEE